MFGNMLEKVKEAKENIDRELLAMRIGEEVQGVRVVVNGHKELISLHIDQSLFTEADAELVSELIMTAMSRATAKARRAGEEKMHNTAGAIMPGFPGF